MATFVLCPICNRPAPPRQGNRSYPFCSDRCRLIDLGKWLSGAYRVAGPLAGDGEEAPGLGPEGGEDEA